jgi:4-hydroxy-tetrahydrodipicolinate reductase
VSAAGAIALLGASGKMGTIVERILAEDPDFRVAVRIDRSLAPDAGPPRRTTSPADLAPGEVEAILDVSSPSGTRAAAEAASRLGCALVSGTTGLDETTQAELHAAAERAAVCWSPNFSVGIPILARALRLVAEHAPASWQLEILEIHHGQKKDAPSGTAWKLAETWRARRPGGIVHGRVGTGAPRPPDEIGVHAARLADVPGEHRLFLAGAGEMIEIVHRVTGREAFARGCVEALRRIVRQGPGWYEWDDLVFGG